MIGMITSTFTRPLMPVFETAALLGGFAVGAAAVAGALAPEWGADRATAAAAAGALALAAGLTAWFGFLLGGDAPRFGVANGVTAFRAAGGATLAAAALTLGPVD
ncbi:MAG: hypothetical protein AAF684_08170, partial [Pseudomonadota bacterium]